MTVTGESAIRIETAAQIRAIRCWIRPSFSNKDAVNESVPKNAVPAKNSGACTRFPSIRFHSGSGSGRGMGEPVMKLAPQLIHLGPAPQVNGPGNYNQA